MKPTTLHRATPKARSSASFPAHIADELCRYDEHLRDVRGICYRQASTSASSHFGLVMRVRQPLIATLKPI